MPKPQIQHQILYIHFVASFGGAFVSVVIFFGPEDNFFGPGLVVGNFFGAPVDPLSFAGALVDVGAAFLAAGFDTGLGFVGADVAAGFFATSTAPLDVTLIGMPAAVITVSPFFSCAFSMSFFPICRVRPFDVFIVVVVGFLVSSTADAGTLILTPEANVTSFMGPVGDAGFGFAAVVGLT